MVTVLLLVISGFLLYSSDFFESKDKTSSSDNDSFVDTKGKDKEFDKTHLAPNENPTFSAWIPDWGSKTGLESLKNNQELFDSISPVWYEVKEDGGLKTKFPSNRNEILKVAEENDIKMIPAIAMFDHELFTKVLQSEENLHRHVDSIYDEVVEQGYDGIDLDYESTKLDDKDKYFEFLEKLSDKLKSQDKELVVTVLAKWGEDIEYSYLPQTRAVQDWSMIAKYADEIRIMTYDYTYGSAKYPGPIAPLGWMEEVLQYAVSEADSSKFVLGVHLYSYEWWEDGENPTGDLIFEPDFIKNTGKAENSVRSYTFETVSRVLRDYTGESDEYQGEKIYKYSKTNDDTGVFENRFLVYIDVEGVQSRVDLAKEYGLKGVVFWRIGGDGQLLDF